MSTLTPAARAAMRVVVEGERRDTEVRISTRTSTPTGAALTVSRPSFTALERLGLVEDHLGDGRADRDGVRLTDGGWAEAEARWPLIVEALRP